MTRDRPALAERVPHLVVAAALVPLGLLSKVDLGAGASWVPAHAGGLFYVMFWASLVLALAPRLSEGVVCGSVLLATCALEFSQLWHPPPLTAARGTVVGQMLLGSSFGWLDFPFYVAGAACAWVLARGIRRRGAPPSGRSRAPDGSPPGPPAPG